MAVKTATKIIISIAKNTINIPDKELPGAFKSF
jgi:hypothetical protein